MARNDMGLYSGLTAPVRRERIEKEQQVTKPDAKAEMVLTEIAKLKAEAMNITAIALDSETPDAVKIRKLERMRERYDDLTILERRMQKLLGIQPKRGKA